MTVSKSPADVATAILRNNSYKPIRELTCTFEDGVLTIGGRLPTFHLKQVAQTAVQGIEGVNAVDNRIEVVN
jgi:osmotically-inducible protein OsmY